MAEIIGVTAAVPQLAKYSFSAANDVKSFVRRVRRAHVTQRQWEDQSLLIASLSQTLRDQPCITATIPPRVIDTIEDDLIKILPVLEGTINNTNDGFITRMKKKVAIVKNEAAINKDFSTVVQRSILCSLNSIHQQLQLPETHMRPASSTTLAQSFTQDPLVQSLPQSRFLMNTIPRNPNSIGQNDLLRLLSQRINDGPGSAIAISGIGGSGKSNLVTELAHLRHATVDEESVFCFDASTNQSLVAGILGIGRCAKLFQGTTDSSGSQITNVVSWLDSTESGTWLIILDNIDVCSVTEPSIQKLLQQPKGRILFTTRNRQFALMYAHPTNFIEMPCMNVAGAKQLLNSYHISSAEDEDIVSHIAVHLECHPLALTRMARYMRSTSSTPAMTLSRLEHDQTFLSTLLTGTESGSTSPPAMRSGTNRLYSMDVLTTQNQDTVTVLSIILCIDSSKLSDEVLNALIANGLTQQALDILKSYYMITRNSLNGSWQMSNLVRSVAKTHLTQSSGRIQYIEAALKFVASICFPCADSLHTSQECNAHMLSILQTTMESTTENEIASPNLLIAARIAIQLCQDLISAGKAKSAAQITFQLITWGQASLKKHLASFDKLCSKLGIAYHSNGQFADAESLTWNVLRSQIRTVGENHVNTLHSLNNMGVIYQDQGRFQVAESYHRKALEMKQNFFGAFHLETFVTINNLALSLQSQKSYADAEVLFDQALRGRQRLLPSNHPDILVSISNLGALLQLRGQFAEAQKMHQYAFTARQRTLGHEHPETLKSKGNVALVLSHLGQHDQSNTMFYEVREAYEKTLGCFHPQTIQTIRNHAILLHRQSDLAGAEKLMREVLAILDEKHGKGQPETFGALQYLATLMHLQGKLEDALDLVAWLYEMRVQILRKEHADTEVSKKHVEELEAELGCARPNRYLCVEIVDT